MRFINTLNILVAVIAGLALAHDPIKCGAVLNIHDPIDNTHDWTVMYLGHGHNCKPLEYPAESYWSKSGCTCALYKSKDCTGMAKVHEVGPKQRPISDLGSYKCYATVDGPFEHVEI